MSLLNALRGLVGLTGAKKGCARAVRLVHGAAGREAVNACLTAVVFADGWPVTTIAGVAEDGELQPAQAAIVQHDVFQCGYCTPVRIMAAAGLLRGTPRPRSSRNLVTRDPRTRPSASAGEPVRKPLARTVAATPMTAAANR